MRLIRNRRAALLAIIITALTFIASPAQAATYSTGSCSNSTTTAPQRPTLYQGDRGDCVRVIQEEMVGDGLLTPQQVDGVFGPKTKAAVKAYQGRRGVRTTGNWGPLTWAASSSVEPGPVQENIDPRSVNYSQREGLAVDISITDRKVRVLRSGAVVLTADARFGGVHPHPETGQLTNYPTDQGVFRSYRKGGDDYRSNSFVDSDGQGALMPLPWFYNRGEAIHFSPGFASNGYNDSSHGCVNLRSMDAAREINALPLGTVVVVH